jgi:hypothetical protein
MESYNFDLPQPTTPTTETKEPITKGLDWKRILFMKSQSQHWIHEQELYMAGPRCFNITETLAWWCAHQGEFPCLATVARDYLAIRPSSTSSERVFSNAGRLITQDRNRLGSVSTRMCMVLNSWLTCDTLCSGIEKLYQE